MYEKLNGFTIDCRDDVFPTQRRAQDYYNKIARDLYNDHESESIINSGQVFNELKEIYTKYCQYTNYKLQELEEHSQGVDS